MSTGKRLAKRSILGTRVCAPTDDGLYVSGVIEATKTDAEEHQNVYCVHFDDKSTGEFNAGDLVGPGFKTVTDIILQEGQRIFVTYNGREVKGSVVRHRPDTDEVELTLLTSAHVNHSVTLKKKLEEIRLIESRKSARLQDTDTDYSRLAEGQPEPRRRAASLSIEVPYGQSCRKRRSSADDGVMDDCMAAMVLMSLSCSPKSPCVPNAGVCPPWAGLASSSGASSYSSCGSGSTRATPSPPSHVAVPESTQDEGIEMDDAVGFIVEDPFPPKRKSPTRTKIVFQCTWPGCGKQYQQCEDVERHVRTKHLGRGDASDIDSSDHEEEFYYTEIEVDSSHQVEPPSPTMVSPEHDLVHQSLVPSIYSSSVPTLSHLDMARPAHEDPEYKKHAQMSGSICATTAVPISIPQLQKSTAWHLHGYAASAPSNMGSPQKCMRLSPKPTSSPTKMSPLHRRTRSESRKCRKVYGMENRDLWCTQCKWKKACTRFVD